MIRFRRMYAVKVKRMMYDQLIFKMRVASTMNAIIPMKQNLSLLYGESFLNLNENIGISLTRRRASTTDATGIRYVSRSKCDIVITPRSAA